jgi:hypothetical protein
MTLTLRTPLLALGLTFALTACGRAAPLTEQEQRTVTELTANLKTRCVGRYLIDLPADVQTSGSATLQGVQVSTEKMTQQEFLKGMQQRDAELKAMKHLKGYQFLYGDQEYPLVMSGVEEQRKKGVWYFIHMGDIDEAPSHRTIEVYKWDRGVRLKLEISASDFTRPDQSEDSIVKQLSPAARNDVGRKLVRALDLAHDFRGRADDDIPTGPGVCIDGGFIAGAASDKERIETSFYLSGRRDVSVDFSSDSSYAEETTLLQRGGEINAAINAVQGKTIRNSVVKLSDISQAEEWLIASTTISGVPGHRFRLEANSKIGSTKTPLLILQMVNGVFPSNIPEAERTKASLTEGEAVALWDAVSRTIRVRPGAMNPMLLPPVVRSTLRVPMVTSGQPCPENGHWVGHCNGKQYKRVFFKGDLMPSMEVMQAKPYRWLPARVNAWLEQRERLPMVKVENELRWHLDSFFSS